MMENIVVSRYQSPVGELLIGSYGSRICMCDWAARTHRSLVDRRICRYLNAKMAEGETSLILEVKRQLDEYFAGHRSRFDLPLALCGTEFQCQVWRELLSISYGTTATYADIARRVGRPSAVRAIASAIGANAISIIVPCHRVIGSNSQLTGYAGGLPAKRHLLNLEIHTQFPNPTIIPGWSFTYHQGRVLLSLLNILSMPESEEASH